MLICIGDGIRDSLINDDATCLTIKINEHMTEEEIYEELEITHGKLPRTTSEKNIIWLKGVLEAHIIEGEFNPSLT